MTQNLQLNYPELPAATTQLLNFKLNIKFHMIFNDARDL